MSGAREELERLEAKLREMESAFAPDAPAEEEGPPPLPLPCPRCGRLMSSGRLRLPGGVRGRIEFVGAADAGAGTPVSLEPAYRCPVCRTTLIPGL